MGKLNIAHHKSYHPYRRDNIERVRRDEEEARLKEAQAEGKMLLADAEARLQHLREKASISSGKDKKKKEREDEKALEKQLRTGVSSTMTAAVAELPTTNGHINFFQDLEQSSIETAIKAARKAPVVETERGVALAPSAKDMKPWYSERSSEPGSSDIPEDKRKRDEYRKSAHDPLTSITKQLSSSKDSRSSSSFRQPSLPSSSSGSTPQDPKQARLARESSERQRALALIEKRKRELAGNQTPSTVMSEEDAHAYSDQFNRNAVLDAHRERERRLSNRRWDEPEPSSRRGWEYPRDKRDSSYGRRRDSSSSQRSRYG